MSARSWSSRRAGGCRSSATWSRTNRSSSTSGRLRLYLEDDDGTVQVEELVAGDHRHVPTGRIHRYEAIERTELIEVSTPELDDVVRLEDDFGREGTSAP